MCVSPAAQNLFLHPACSNRVGHLSSSCGGWEQEGRCADKSFSPQPASHPPTFLFTSPTVALKVDPLAHPARYTYRETALTVWKSTQLHPHATSCPMLSDAVYLLGTVIRIFGKCVMWTCRTRMMSTCRHRWNNVSTCFQRSQIYNMCEIIAWKRCLLLPRFPRFQ